MKDKKVYKTDKKGIIISLLIFSFVLMLSVGYAALNEELTISGEAHFRVESDIRITDVRLSNTINSASEDYASLYGKESMKVGATLPNNNSSVTYKVKITNYSNVPMKITKIEKETVDNNYAITFNKTLPLTVGKLSEEEIEITFKNNTSVSQTINANLLFTFEKLEAMMTEGNRNVATSTFYNGSLTKDSIESITFMSTKEIPEDAIGYWDCSYTQGSNEVIAYYLNGETEGMYDLYIAADGEVYAPSNSSALFSNFSNLLSMNFNNSFNTEKSTNMEHLFNGNRKLNNLNLSSFKTSNVTKMGKMFYLCTELAELNLSNFDTSNLASIYTSEYGGMFEGCASLVTLSLDKFNTSKITNMGYMFNGCKKLTKLNLSSFNTINLKNMASMFQGCSSLSNIIFGNNFDTINVTNMSYVFYNCSSLTNLDLSKWKTVNVTNMSNMFYNCQKLVELDLSGFNTGKVTSMNASNKGMFQSCLLLKSIKFGENFDTSKISTMKYMFAECKALQNVDLSNFNTSNVTNMYGMFRANSNLEKVNLSSFDITNATNIGYMFYNCQKLQNVDIRNMDFENKTIDTTYIFYQVPSGVNIYVLNEYNKQFIQGLKSNANVIIPEA